MKLEHGNILNGVTSGVIIQQVNAQGVMGSGVAKAIRERYPKVWTEYSAQIKPSPEIGLDGAQHLGKLIMVEVVENQLWVANIVGQQFYGRDGKRYTSYDALDEGLQKLWLWSAWAQDNQNGRMLLEFHHPAIGSGLGGAHWSIVASIIEHRLGSNTTLWLL